MNGEPQQASNRPPAPDLESATPRKPPKVRLDESRDFSTVHGDRGPHDPHVRVFYYQSGLPFGADKLLLWEHPETQDEKNAKALQRAIKRAEKAERDAPGDDAFDVEEEDRDNDDEDEADRDIPVSLEKWARGLQKIPWQAVTDAITRRFSKRVQNKRQALELLVAEGLVTVNSLSPQHRSIVQSD